MVDYTRSYPVLMMTDVGADDVPAVNVLKSYRIPAIRITAYAQLMRTD